MDTSETRRRRGQPIRGLLLIGFRRNERVRAATVAQREQKAHRQRLERRVHGDRSHGDHNPYRPVCLVLHVFQCIPGKLLASLDARTLGAFHRTGEGRGCIGAHAFHRTRSPTPCGGHSGRFPAGIHRGQRGDGHGWPARWRLLLVRCQVHRHFGIAYRRRVLGGAHRPTAE